MGRVTRLTILAVAVATAVFALAPPVAAETLRITEPPTPMAGTVTVPFSYTFTARPGTGLPPYRFRLHTDSGPMPSGLTLSENGLLSGTPTAYGTWIFRATVFDANSAASSSGQITFNVNVLPMAFGPGPAAVIPALVNYQFQFAPSGGMPPYTIPDRHPADRHGCQRHWASRWCSARDRHVRVHGPGPRLSNNSADRAITQHRGRTGNPRSPALTY